LRVGTWVTIDWEKDRPRYAAPYSKHDRHHPEISKKEIAVLHINFAIEIATNPDLSMMYGSGDLRSAIIHLNFAPGSGSVRFLTNQCLAFDQMKYSSGIVSMNVRGS